MTTRNDITGDPIASKPATEQYRENFDRIFNRDAGSCTVCGQVTATCPKHGDGIGLCDKCDPRNCCRS